MFGVFVQQHIIIKYHLRFNENRKFNELENVDLKKALSADVIDESLRGLKWITKAYPDNPEKEIENLKEAMEIIKKNNKKKAIITSYQFIAPALGIYDYSPNQWHHPSVSFPLEGQKYFLKSFMILLLITRGDARFLLKGIYVAAKLKNTPSFHKALMYGDFLVNVVFISGYIPPPPYPTPPSILPAGCPTLPG